MDFRQTLDDLYGLQHFGIKLGLDNIRALLDRLQQPQAAYPVIHLAGTNGKGSTAAALAAILSAAGLRTGLYTSPHLQSFTERIQIDGCPISEAEVAALYEVVRPHTEGLQPTFFEVTTAMAFEHFRRQQVQVAVVETGMGGRLDATNVVQPVLTLITPVSDDHRDHLGHTLMLIALEKAGILKPKVPLLLGRQPEEAGAAIRDRAQRLEVPVRELGVAFQRQSGAQAFDYRGPTWQLAGLRPALAGRHQHDNMALALAAAEWLAEMGWPVAPEAARAAVEALCWPGRLEWWGPQRRLLLDGAHNGAGIATLLAYLQEQGQTRLRWVAGVKEDKEPQALLAPLLPLCVQVYATAAATAGTDPAALAAIVAAAGCPVATFADPVAALQSALTDCQPGEIVLVAGSLYLVGELRAALEARPGDDPLL